MATVLLYLTDTEEGGETAFPAGSAWSDPASPQRYGPFSECAQGSVAVRPRKGALRRVGPSDWQASVVSFLLATDARAH